MENNYYNNEKENLVKWKACFMILNLVIAIVGFSYLIGVQTVSAEESPCGPGGCNIPILPPSIVPNPSLGGNAKVPGLNIEIPDNPSFSRKTPDLIPNGRLDNLPGSPSIPDSPCGPGGCAPPLYPGTPKAPPITPGAPDLNIPTPDIPPGIEGPSGGTPAPTPPQTPGKSLGGLFAKDNLKDLATSVGFGSFIGGIAGAIGGGKNGEIWGAVSGAVGGLVYNVASQFIANPLYSVGLGVGVGALIFILTYKKESQEVVEFQCLPWQAPIGGGDCELCNEFEECSEYTCKSLGQACDLINKGSEEEKCVWVNPHDTNSPIIKMLDVNEGHVFSPDSLRPSGTGVVIKPKDAECIKAFMPLEFTFTTKDEKENVGEPAQCKVDYNLTSGLNSYEEMSYYVGGDSLFKYNHTERLALPGPDAINAVAPELQNDGSYTLYVRCIDANGNFNQDAYSVRFCVEKGPDTTPPLIVNTNVPSESPVQFNNENLDLEVYVNEPADCKWSRENIAYDVMQNEMECSNELWEMNNKNSYTCKTTLTGIEDRKENKYYFRCKDQPNAADPNDRNPNTKSYLYNIIGTQPLNILSVSPSDETIAGATDSIPAFLEVQTDNGYDNGKATCYYFAGEVENEEDYIEFSETGENIHKQRQDLIEGDYEYSIKCVDLGGNVVYNSTEFSIDVDREEPIIVRTYKEAGDLKIMTNEDAECSYSNKDCNFDIADGISMSTSDFNSHTSDWTLNHNYYIRCMDKDNNQPNPATCSIIVRASESMETGVVVL